MKLTKKKLWLSGLVVASLACALSSCYSPSHSQAYFIKASKTDPALEPVYSTSLYTVYYDYAIMKCVLHSSHTWGQNGGGGGGTGIGVSAFPCDPNRIRARAQGLGVETFAPKMSPPVAPAPQQRQQRMPGRSTRQGTAPAPVPSLYPQTTPEGAFSEPSAGQPLN